VALSDGAYASPAPGAGYVKYYLVQTSYQGKPETLTEIAVRFLGDANRSGEIFDLNKGRVQPDGGVLTDPAKLHPGWAIVLPWDAAGESVRYGLVPTAAARPAGPPSPSAHPHPSMSPSGSCAATSPGARPSPISRQWAQLRLAPERAWSRTRGQGVTVAVVDSGVDDRVAQLSGHVRAGADIVTGQGAGNVDCQGQGTAVAGIIAAQPGSASGVIGMAPGAMILPIRVTVDQAIPLPANLGRGIDVAASAGAQVICVASSSGMADPQVANAITDAVRHDVVVVVGAATVADRALPADPGGLLRVGGIDVDGALTAQYQPGGVDVVAPGADLTSLARDGTTVQVGGAGYGAAFVAGLAALLRAANPSMSAADVVRRIETTAEHGTAASSDPRYGAGLINPELAAAGLAGPSTGAGQQAQTGRAGGVSAGAAADGKTVALCLIALLCVLAGALAIWRVRRTLRGQPEADPSPPEPPALTAREKEPDEAPDPGMVPVHALSSSQRPPLPKRRPVEKPDSAP
jgi:hypothetical protein